MARDIVIMRILLPSVVALLALTWAGQAMAQEVYYDQYGNHVVAQAYDPAPAQTTTVVVVPTTPYMVTPYMGPASPLGQSRRVARRTSRRVAHRN